jgi:hypothetical protein
MSNPSVSISRTVSQNTLRLFLLLLCAPFVARAELLPLKTYTVADGLANNVINKIVRDPRGFLWFCTNEGLSRFDGYSFRNFGTQQGLPNTVVNDLLVTREGEYWVASNGGLVRFNPKAAPSSEAIDVNGDSSKQPHMFSVIVPAGDDRRAKVVNVLVEGRDGTIWCGTYNGLYRLVRSANKLGLEPVELKLPNTGPPPGLIGALLEDQLGALWIGTSAGLYRRAPDGSATLYAKGDGLPDDFVHSLFQDHAGRLWVGTRYAGLFSLSANSAPTKPTIGFHLDSNNGHLHKTFYTLAKKSAKCRRWVSRPEKARRPLVIVAGQCLWSSWCCSILRVPDIQFKFAKAICRSLSNSSRWVIEAWFRPHYSSQRSPQ